MAQEQRYCGLSVQDEPPLRNRAQQRPLIGRYGPMTTRRWGLHLCHAFEDLQAGEGRGCTDWVARIHVLPELKRGGS